MNSKTILKHIPIFCLPIIIGIFSVLPLSAATTPGSPQVISGAVLETMNGAGYTYVKLDTEQGEIWAALPETAVEKGANIAIQPGMEMKNFHSNAFDRDFDSIIFSAGIATAGATDTVAAPSQQQKTSANSFDAAVAAEKKSAGAPEQPRMTSGGSMGAVAPFTETAVEKAEGEDSYTVAEIYEQAQALNGKHVKVRGQLVKFNANIMGRNWLHLQDGSGDPMQNTHDLVVTTTEDVPGPGVITVEGTLAADRDFGAGYSYAVIIENGTIVK